MIGLLTMADWLGLGGVRCAAPLGCLQRAYSLPVPKVEKNQKDELQQLVVITFLCKLIQLPGQLLQDMNPSCPPSGPRPNLLRCRYSFPACCQRHFDESIAAGRRRIDVRDYHEGGPIKVKGEDKYLYRALDSTGQTIDFLLTAKRDTAAAKRFLRRAIEASGNPMPRVMNVDKNPAYPAAVEALKAEGAIPHGSLYASASISIT